MGSICRLTGLQSNNARAIGVACCMFAAVAVRPTAAQTRLPGERDVRVAGIAGVVAPGASWERAWSGFDNADGIVGTPDGGLLFAQEQPSRIRKLEANGRDSIF